MERGTDPEGRTHTVTEVPNELVDDVLSISGKHWLIVGFIIRDREAKKKHDEERVRISLPEECNIKGCSRQHKELQNKSKEAAEASSRQKVAMPLGRKKKQKPKQPERSTQTKRGGWDLLWEWKCLKHGSFLAYHPTRTLARS